MNVIINVYNLIIQITLPFASKKGSLQSQNRWKTWLWMLLCWFMQHEN